MVSLRIFLVRMLSVWVLGCLPRWFRFSAKSLLLSRLQALLPGC